MKILSVFTHLMLFQTSSYVFVLLNTKEDIWKNVLIKQISFCLIKTLFQISSFVFSRTNINA